MSKERELLKAMRDSLNGTESIGKAGEQAGSAADSGGAGAALMDAWDVTASLASSLAADPLFYLKVVGVLALTIIIIMISLELIASGG